MDEDKIAVVEDALSQVLTLFYHLKGPTRVAYFGLTVLNTFPEPIFPIQLLRNNFPRIQSALSELKFFSSPTPSSGSHLRPSIFSSEQAKNCLVEGIEEVILQFQRVAKTFRQDSTNTFPSQLEVTLITSRSQNSVQSSVNKSAGRIDVDCLSKIQVICLDDGEGGLQEDHDVATGGVGCSEGPDHPEDSLSSGLLEACRVGCEAGAVLALLKHWLHQTAGEEERVLIRLPGTDSSNPVVLKCDTLECVVDPALIPAFQQHFSLRDTLLPAPATSTSANTSSRSLAVQSGTDQALRVRELETVMLLPSEGVCESVVLGFPLVLRPTSCWKLDWEELESNSHSFAALCKLLREQDQVLVVCEHHSPPSPSSPRGHFLVLPSPSSSAPSLLIKPLVVSELHLHSSLTEGFEEPSCQAVLGMESVLSRVPYSELYNPLEVHSGLYKSLQIVTTKKGPSARGGRGRGGAKRGGATAERGSGVTGSDVISTGSRGGIAGNRGSVAGRGALAGSCGAKRKSQVEQQMEGFGSTHQRSLGPKRTKVSEFVQSIPSVSLRGGAAHRRATRFIPPPLGLHDDFEFEQ